MLVPRRACRSCGAGLVDGDTVVPELRVCVARDSGGPVDATLCCAAGARVESSSMNTSGSRRGGIGGALLIIAVPVIVASAEAAWYFVANRSNGSFVSSGEQRDYLLYVPKGYDRTK